MRKTDSGYLIWCPTCDEAHLVAVEKPMANGALWSFNGNLDSPSFEPSLLVKTGRAVDPNFKPEFGDPPEVCHSFIRNGEWQYCGDSTHDLAGQTVPVVEWDRSEK